MQTHSCKLLMGNVDIMYMYAYTVRVGASLNEIISSLPDDGGLFWSGVAPSVWRTHLGSRAWTRRCGVGARRGNSADYPLIWNRIALQWIYSPNRCNLVYFSEGIFPCQASRSRITHVCQERWHYCHVSGALTLNTELQTLAVLSRWSWARVGTSFQTVRPRRTKRGERLTRGNTWLSAGDVKKLNRCVLGTSVAFVLTSLHSCTSTLTKAQQSNPGLMLPAVLRTSYQCKCVFILGESEDSWSTASSPKNYPSYEEGETVPSSSASASRPLSSHLSGAVCEHSVHLPGFSWRL